MNICGVLVHADPRRLDAVAARIASLPGVTVHAIAAPGRLVVTTEDTERGLAIDQIAAIHRTEGVVAAALVYHHFDSPADSPAAPAVPAPRPDDIPDAAPPATKGYRHARPNPS